MVFPILHHLDIRELPFQDHYIKKRKNRTRTRGGFYAFR